MRKNGHCEPRAKSQEPRAKNNNLNVARDAKKDEFYTQLDDINRELHHYKDHFRGKTVYCNCDDPRVSNFFHYFSHNFEHLGLKRLITTCYKSKDMEDFSQGTAQQAVWLEYTGDKNGNRVPDPTEIGIHPLQGDGDFRSDECIDLLKQADIVVTNPPFSLFREYVQQLVEHGKEFLIIGNVNSITYKDVFKLIQANRVWFGPSIRSGDREFAVPDEYPLSAAGFRVDENGRKYIRVKGVRWFTNMDFKERHEDLILFKKYTAEAYPTYDNYTAIEVSKTADIPNNYFAPMGVPITFLDRHNPYQFEILGITDRDNNSGLKIKEYAPQDAPNHSDLNRRAAINKDGVLISTYARLLIRRKV